MTNILPQAATTNRSAWLRTEEIIECYRGIDELVVLGGVLWGDNSADDSFVQSHGIQTPDAYWKLILRGTGRVIAWIVPNTEKFTFSLLQSSLSIQTPVCGWEDRLAMGNAPESASKD